MTSLRITVAVLVLMMVLGAGHSSSQTRMQSIMRTKLSNTQVLLRAIVTANYRDVDQAAAALNRISESEIVSWQNPPRPEYTNQAMLFLTTVEALQAAAKRRDIQTVGDEYGTLVSTCIRCHAYVRDARVATLPAHGFRGDDVLRLSEE